MTPQDLASLTVSLILVFLWVGLPAILTYRVTKRKNRNYRLWTLFALIFNWATFILSLLVTKKEVKQNY